MVVAGKYVRIILSPNLVTFSCIGYSMKNIFRTAKFLPTWGLSQRYCPDRHNLWLYLYTVVYKWPVICCIGWQVQRSSHQLVIIITMCPSDGDIYLHLNPFWIFHEKYIPNGKVLAHLGFESKVLSGPLTDLNAWVGFCSSSPQQGVKYQL
jgi:hypothetical protein